MINKVSKRPLKNSPIEDLEKKSDLREFAQEVLNELNYRNTNRAKRLKNKLILRNSFEMKMENTYQRESFESLVADIDNVFFSEKEFSKFRLKPRTLNALEGAGFKVIGDLAQMSSIELLRLPNLGQTSLDEVIDLLSSIQNCKTEDELNSILGERLDKKFETYVSQYNQGLTLEEIGISHNITREAIRQKLAKAKRNGYEIVSKSENSKIRNKKRLKKRLTKNLQLYKAKIISLYLLKEADSYICDAIGLPSSEYLELKNHLIEEGVIAKRIGPKITRRKLEWYNEKERFDLIISMREESATLGEISKAAGVSKAAIAANIKSMQARGIRVPGSRVRTDVDLETRYYRTSLIKAETEKGTHIDEIAAILGMSREGVYRHLRLYMDE